MIVKTIHNNIKTLTTDLQQFAFGQDEKGVVDLTVGKTYKVYGTRNNKFGRFYLVLTDTVNTKLPWWMAADFFQVIDDKIPPNWETDSWDGYGRETVEANPIYFNASADIEDGTQKGYEVFAVMKRDL
jgi:hypothetical protein